MDIWTMSAEGNVTNGNATLSFQLSYVSAVSCGLSIFGAIGILLTFVLFPDIRNTTRKLLIFLTIADLIQPTGYLAAIVVQGFGDHVSNKDFCKIQSAVTTYSSLVSFFLTVAIAGYLFVAINRRSMSSTCVLVVSNVVSWAVPGIIIAIALNAEMLGRNDSDRSVGTGPWCWVNFDKYKFGKSIAYMSMAGKGWELACYLLTATFYVLLKFKLYLRHRFKHLNEINADLRDGDKNFLYVWLVLLAIRAWGTIRFFMLIASEGEMHYYSENLNTVLSYLQAIGDPSQALFNFILFCLLDRDVRQKMCQRCTVCRTGKYATIYNNDVNCDETQERRIMTASIYEESYTDNGHIDQVSIQKSNERAGILSKSDTSSNAIGSKRKYGSVPAPLNSFLNKSFTV
ncbi:G-protein coupled receptor 157-like isoform X2 [Dreissena polymorpha]|uniref:G-protein coupled receptor 157-like isoform X2 n=1 Tax=Dreissena polymorpha TaxID=45954 RepID=UPI002263D83E|nr:G-protein coupled receptor 157-like isoform X2 [Dreissena polymorpha]